MRSIGGVQSADVVSRERRAAFPVGAAVTVGELETDPHPVLARLRAHEPVSWLPALDAWYVTSRDLALRVLRDPGTFTVDDPRFSTARVVGASMLSTDGSEHARHRGPFARAYRLDAVRTRFAALVEDEAERLVAAIEPRGRAELRAAVTGPLAAVSMVHALGLAGTDVTDVLRWYEAIVATVTDITAGRPDTGGGAAAFRELRTEIERVLQDDPASALSVDEVVSNTAVLLFGGIETTDGMIANAVLHLLSNPTERELVEREPGLLGGAIEESLRLEPAAAVVDRYSTCATSLGGADIGELELVRVSLAGANRDPDVFPEPDRFDVRRPNAHLQLAFAQGPHVCLGMHLARVEAAAALRRLLRLPGLRLDPERPSAVDGLVFRKPADVHVVWR